MKKIFWALLLASTLGFAQKPKTGWQTANLKGKVKSAGQIEYAPNDKGELEKRGQDFSAKFNTKGYITEMELAQGDKRTKLTMVFDERGFLSKILSLNSEGKPVIRNIQEVDDKGNVLVDKSFSEDGMEGLKTVYTYDANGFTTEKVEYNLGTLGQKTIYVNDKKGNPIEEAVYNKRGKLSYKIVSKYDKKGKRTEAIAYNAKGEVMEHYTYKYDKRGNLIEEKSFAPEGEVNYTKVSSYEYDKKKNWTKRTEHTNGTLSLVAEQFVEYY